MRRPANLRPSSAARVRSALGLSALILGCTSQRAEPESTPRPEPRDAVFAAPAEPEFLEPLVAHECNPLSDRREVDYLAELSDGRWLAKIRGRVFFGQPKAMVERAYWLRSIPKGPGDGILQFFVGDELVRAVFPRPMRPPPGVTKDEATRAAERRGTVYIDGESIGTEVRSVSALPDATFICDAQEVRLSWSGASARADDYAGGYPTTCSAERSGPARFRVSGVRLRARGLGTHPRPRRPTHRSDDSSRALAFQPGGTPSEAQLRADLTPKAQLVHG